MVMKISLGCTNSVFPIENGVTVERGAFGTLTAATGLLSQGGTGAGVYSAGIISGPADGLSLTGNAGGTIKAAVESGCTVEMDVTGVTGKADVLSKVYITAAKTLSLTPPAGSVACGVVKEHISGTLCKVYLYTLSELTLL